MYLHTASNLVINKTIYKWGRRVIRISGSLIWPKTLMELIFNPRGEFRWSREGLVSQIHSPHIHAGAPVIFSDLLRSVQMIQREWDAKSNGKLLHPCILSLRNLACSSAKGHVWKNSFHLEQYTIFTYKSENQNVLPKGRSFTASGCGWS